MNGSNIIRRKSTDNLKHNKSNRYYEEFDKNMNYHQEDSKESSEEDGYNSFLRKYDIDGKGQEITTNQDSINLGQVSNYSNFIEQKKVENDLSFSNNIVEPNSEYKSEDSDDKLNTIENLDNIDLNYEEFARKQMSENEYFQNEDEQGK